MECFYPNTFEESRYWFKDCPGLVVALAMDKCSPHEVMVKSEKRNKMLNTALPIITLLVD